jgi:hypothetical protein
MQAGTAKQTAVGKPVKKGDYQNDGWRKLSD